MHGLSSTNVALITPTNVPAHVSDVDVRSCTSSYRLKTLTSVIHEIIRPWYCRSDAHQHMYVISVYVVMLLIAQEMTIRGGCAKNVCKNGQSSCTCHFPGNFTVEC